MTRPVSNNGSNGLNELDRCKTCQQTRLWHDNNNPIHPFNDGQAGATAFLNRTHNRPGNDAPRRSEGPQVIPSDPVLRIALINRGIITPADLAAAEEQLRVALVSMQGENGETTVSGG